jgi:alcohol dehydrogenase
MSIFLFSSPNENSSVTLTKDTDKTMKALVYLEPEKIEWKEVAMPTIQKPTDAIVKILKTTICRTDLNLVRGKKPLVKTGTTLGHEGIGIIKAVGTSVSNFKEGDRVIISCITADGSCEYCKKQMYAHCEDGGWILGNLINGTQAEYVRIPHADNSLYAVPKGIDEDTLLLLSDVLPTGHEIGVINGFVKSGKTVAIVGAGPIGMSALLSAQSYSPAKIYMIDLDENLLKMAKKLGATHTINSGEEDAIKKIMSETKTGVDVAIEAIGTPITFDICKQIISPGGHLANIGIHGPSLDLQSQGLWRQNITTTTGVLNTHTTPLHLKTVKSGKVKSKELITYRFKLSEIIHAYEVFGNAAKEKDLKIILNN